MVTKVVGDLVFAGVNRVINTDRDQKKVEKIISSNFTPKNAGVAAFGAFVATVGINPTARFVVFKTLKTFASLMTLLMGVSAKLTFKGLKFTGEIMFKAAKKSGQCYKWMSVEELVNAQRWLHKQAEKGTYFTKGELNDRLISSGYAPGIVNTFKIPTPPTGTKL